MNVREPGSEGMDYSCKSSLNSNVSEVEIERMVVRMMLL